MSQGASDMHGNLIGAGDQVYFGIDGKVVEGEVVEVDHDGYVHITPRLAEPELYKRFEKDIVVCSNE